jgi:3-isopropylmalate dehydrogenase
LLSEMGAFMPDKQFRIAVLPGDGIGREVIDPTITLLELAADLVGGFTLSFDVLPAGAAHYATTGEAMPASTFASAKQADAILLGAMGDPSIRYPDGTEISPQLQLRFDLGLYAGVRPVRALPKVPSPLADPRSADLDFVLIRESTEGLFASYGKGTVENDAIARETLVITRAVSERLFDFAFDLARRRKQQGRPGIVTCVDKANVFSAFAFFRRIFDERATRFPDIEARHAYVDATALDMVRKPWNFDVLVTENMFGDILSDLGAGLIGGMGMAPSADVGDEHAVFQPCHGSAPDITGTGKANPTATFLSGAMMLEWLAVRHSLPACDKAAALLRKAVDRAFAGGKLVTAEFGGSAGTLQVTEAVLANVK